MKQYFAVILTMAKLFTKRFFRDTTAMFFTFVFPLIFLLVFGALFGNDQTANFNIALINQSTTDFSKQFEQQVSELEVVTVEEQTISIDQAKEQMSRGELDTILLLPPEFGQLNEQGVPLGTAEVYFDPGNPQGGQTFASIIESVLGGVQVQLTQQEPLFEVQQISTDTRGLSGVSFITAGLVGFALLSLGFFGPTNALPGMKKEGVLRRLRVTPLRTSQFVLGQTLSNLLVGVVAALLMLIAGIFLFNVEVVGDWLSLLMVIVIGAMMMFGFGLAIGGWARTENQAAPLANLTAFPMMFLSGTFFPRFIMPEWLQAIAAFLPLTPLIDSLRFIITEGKSLLDLGPQLALMGLWLIIIYTVAFRVFRWE